MAADLRWWVAGLNNKDASIVVAKRHGGTGSAMHLQCNGFGFLKPNWPY